MNAKPAFSESEAMSRLALLVMAIAALSPVATGCGGTGSDEPKPVAVSGTVTVNQKPLSFATLEFIPKDGSAVFVPVTDGRFSVPADRGLIAGQYNVRVRPYSPEIEELQAMPPEQRQAVIDSRRTLPRGYDRSGALTAQISGGSANELAFDLKAYGRR